jgi:hypothetical protein
MIDTITKVMDKAAPLKRHKNPQLAAVIGFVLGGIGLGIYFMSFVDFLIPVGIAIAATVTFSALNTGLIGLLAGAIIAALWGYFRAINSNERLEKAEQSPQSMAVPHGTS